MTAFYRVDFQIANNEDLRHDFVLSDTTAAPIDLTGTGFRMDVASVSGGRILEASLDNGRILLTDAAHGRFALSVPAAVMRMLSEGAYNHDLIWTRGSETRRVWSGTMTVQHGVTQ